MSKEAARAYLIAAQRKTLGVWKLPAGISANQCVVARFFVLPTGELRTEPEILSGDDPMLRQSVIAAIVHAAPFEPMPETAQCLALVPMIGMFSNPPR